MLRPLMITCVLLILIGCKDPVTVESPVMATEQWRINVPQEVHYAEMDIRKHEDSTLSCTGNWFYSFFGNNITCQIMSGGVQKDSSYLTFICRGRASYPPDSSGNVESSYFNLKMSGQFKNGICSGAWDIDFNDSEWDEWAPEGNFTGMITGGAGITN